MCFTFFMAVLGELEHSIMEVLWGADEPLSVRSVHETLLRRRELAYTTVMTVLDRLSKKHMVARTLDGRAWLYTPVVDMPQLVANEVGALLDESADRRADTLRAIADRLTPLDREQLRALL